MKINLLIIALLVFSQVVIAQSNGPVNQTDKSGKKTGYWIKKEGNILIYEGFFKDDHPVGEFKRYNKDNTLRSVLLFSEDGREADATIYHLNGYVASKGKYINQLKEGKWDFYSAVIEGFLICEEEYSKNMKNGLSVKYYPGEIVAEKLNYLNDVRHGEWTRYHLNGVLSLKTNYLSGKINGNFEVWFENGVKEVTGEYKNDKKEGHWLIYKEDGTIRYELDYIAGFADDRQMRLDENNFIDSLEKNIGKIPDPEKTGELW